jgi:hypothetical protein
LNRISPRLNGVEHLGVQSLRAAVITRLRRDLARLFEQRQAFRPPFQMGVTQPALQCPANARIA